MLTKTDLSAIEKIVRKVSGVVVREEIEAEGENIRSEVMSEIKLAGMRSATELREINDRLKNLEITSKKIQTDLRKTSDFLDRENLKVVKRVDKIENHLSLSESAVI